MNRESALLNFVYYKTKLNLFVLIKNVITPELTDTKAKQSLGGLVSHFTLTGDRQIANKTKDNLDKELVMECRTMLELYKKITGKGEIVDKEKFEKIVFRGYVKTEDDLKVLLRYYFASVSLFIPVTLTLTYVYVVSKKYNLVDSKLLSKYKEITKSILLNELNQFPPTFKAVLNDEIRQAVVHILDNMDKIVNRVTHVNSLNTYDNFMDFVNKF